MVPSVGGLNPRPISHESYALTTRPHLGRGSFNLKLEAILLWFSLSVIFFFLLVFYDQKVLCYLLVATLNLFQNDVCLATFICLKAFFA